MNLELTYLERIAQATHLQSVFLERIADSIEIHNTLYLAYLNMAFSPGQVDAMLDELAEGDDDE